MAVHRPRRRNQPLGHSPTPAGGPGRTIDAASATVLWHDRAGDRQEHVARRTQQDFSFGPDHPLRRHDHHVDTAGGFAAAQYVYDTVEADGIRLPTKRRACTWHVPVGADGRAPRTVPTAHSCGGVGRPTRRAETRQEHVLAAERITSSLECLVTLPGGDCRTRVDPSRLASPRTGGRSPTPGLPPMRRRSAEERRCGSSRPRSGSHRTRWPQMPSVPNALLCRRPKSSRLRTRQTVGRPRRHPCARSLSARPRRREDASIRQLSASPASAGPPTRPMALMCLMHRQVSQYLISISSRTLRDGCPNRRLVSGLTTVRLARKRTQGAFSSE